MRQSVSPTLKDAQVDKRDGEKTVLYVTFYVPLSSIHQASHWNLYELNFGNLELDIFQELNGISSGYPHSGSDGITFGWLGTIIQGLLPRESIGQTVGVLCARFAAERVGLGAIEIFRPGHTKLSHHGPSKLALG